MRTIKRWLLPALTCLAAVAAVLTPPYLSRLRDRELTDVVHTEAVTGNRLSAAETALEERIGLLYRWSTMGDHIVGMSQSLTESEFRRRIQPFADKAFTEFCKANPMLGEAMSAMAYFGSGSRLLLRDTAGGQAASLLVVHGGPGSVELIIDEQTGLVLSIKLSDGAAGPFPFVTPHLTDGNESAACAECYLDYIGISGEVTSWGDTHAKCILSGCGAEYMVWNDGQTAAICPSDSGTFSER